MFTKGQLSSIAISNIFILSLAKETLSNVPGASSFLCKDFATSSSGEIITLVKKIDEELIKDVKIFDVYQGDNIPSDKKSIAFNVTIEPKDKTLSEKDIDQISKKIILIVQKTTGATLRS